MRSCFFVFVVAFTVGFPHPADGQIRPDERGAASRIDNDPEIVRLEEVLANPLELAVVREAPVFSDHNGRHRLGFLRADQTVKLEAMTDKAYRVRGQGTRDGIAGWVAPWAFTAREPDFVDKLAKLYERQIEVRKLIEARQAAIGMSLEEVRLALGQPTKTTVRQTAGGSSGTWEFITYEEEKQYAARVDPHTGRLFRVLTGVAQIERGKTVVEFENNLVTAIEESTAERGGNVRIIVPPLLLRW
jgi:mannose-6-phosphate isomerase-like protein (cupin superfamily)